MERISNYLPQPDPAMQKRMERGMPLRAELLRQIQSVWAVLLVCLVAALLWLGVNPLMIGMATGMPALFLLLAWSKLKPFASAMLAATSVMLVAPHPEPEIHSIPIHPFRLTSIQFYPQWFRRPLSCPSPELYPPEPLQIESLGLSATTLHRAISQE